MTTNTPTLFEVLMRREDAAWAASEIHWQTFRKTRDHDALDRCNRLTARCTRLRRIAMADLTARNDAATFSTQEVAS